MAHHGGQAAAWRALTLCVFATVVIFIPYVGYSTQIPAIMHDLRMNYAMAGALASATALVGGFATLAAGVLVDRWGAKRVAVLGLVIAGVGQIGFATAATFQGAVLARVLEGLGIPLLFLGPYTLAMRWAEATDQLGIFVGTMSATDGMGAIVALYAYSAVLSACGWRKGSLIGAAVVLVIAIVEGLSLKEPPSFANPPAATGSFGSSIAEYLSVIGNRNVLVAAAFLVGGWGVYSISVYWVPTLLTQEGGWSENAAGFAGALFPLSGIITSIGFGLISDKLGHRRPLMLVSGVGMVGAFMVAALAVSTRHYDVLAATLPLAGLFAYGGIPLSYCLAADSVGVRRASRANAFIMASGLIVGGVLYPLLLGYVKDATGRYAIGFVAAAISVLILNVLVVLLARDTKMTNGAPCECADGGKANASAIA